MVSVGNNRSILKFLQETKNASVSILSSEQSNVADFFSSSTQNLLENNDFFYNSKEVIFRSFTEIIKIVGKKYYPVRGKKIDHILDKIRQNRLKKETLGGCVIKKVNQTVIISKEY